MIRAGVPCVPGSEGALPDSPKEIVQIARKIGYPVIIKAAGGGGGRGMRVVHTEAALINAVTMTKTEAGAAFGNPEVYMEKYLENPRHVESRFWPIRNAMRSGSANVTARCSVATRKSSKKHRPPASRARSSKKSVSAAPKPAAR